MDRLVFYQADPRRIRGRYTIDIDCARNFDRVDVEGIKTYWERLKPEPKEEHRTKPGRLYLRLSAEDFSAFLAIAKARGQTAQEILHNLVTEWIKKEAVGAATHDGPKNRRSQMEK